MHRGPRDYRFNSWLFFANFPSFIRQRRSSCNQRGPFNRNKLFRYKNLFRIECIQKRSKAFRTVFFKNRNVTVLQFLNEIDRIMNCRAENVARAGIRRYADYVAVRGFFRNIIQSDFFLWIFFFINSDNVAARNRCNDCCREFHGVPTTYRRKKKKKKMKRS